MQIILRQLKELQSSMLESRLFQSAFWSLMAEALSKGLLLLALIVVARVLDKEEFGQFGLIRTTIAMFATFGGMGLGLTANRYVAQLRFSDKPKSGRVVGASYSLALVSGVIIGGAVFCGASFITNVALNAPALTGSIQIAAGLIVLNAYAGAQIGILQGLEAYKKLAFASCIHGLTGLFAVILGALMQGFSGALYGLLMHAVLGVAIHQICINVELKKQEIKVSYSGYRSLLPIFWSFSIPVVLMGVAVAPFRWLVETSLAKNSGFAELGVFHASMNAISILIAIVSTLNAPLISMMGRHVKEGSEKRAKYITLYGSWYVFLIICLPILVYPESVSLLYGEGYNTASFHFTVLLLLIYCGLLLYYQGVMRLVAYSGSMWFGFVTNLFEGVALFLSFVALKSYGVIGLATAFALSYLVRVLISLPVLARTGTIGSRLLYDKYFVLSIIIFMTVVGLHMWRLS